MHPNFFRVRADACATLSTRIPFEGVTVPMENIPDLTEVPSSQSLDLQSGLIEIINLLL